MEPSPTIKYYRMESVENKFKLKPRLLNIAR